MKLEAIQQHVPMGDGNTIWCCKGCGKTLPQISIDNGKHYGNCKIKAIDTHLNHYRNLLRDEMGGNPRMYMGLIMYFNYK